MLAGPPSGSFSRDRRTATIHAAPRIASLGENQGHCTALNGTAQHCAALNATNDRLAAPRESRSRHVTFDTSGDSYRSG
jgi:hypothetical protein